MPISLNWSSTSLTVLGCKLTHDGLLDWEPLLEKFEGELSLWKHQNLSFRGRALVANALGLSLFWYQATSFDVPKPVISKINKMLFMFVCGKKWEWLARTSVTQSVLAGGLGVIDVERKLSSLRAVWFRRYFSNPQHPWTVFFNYYVFNIFGVPVKDLLVRDFIVAYHIKKLPPFYADLLRVWAQLKGVRTSGSWEIPTSVGEPVAISKLIA